MFDVWCLMRDQGGARILARSSGVRTIRTTLNIDDDVLVAAKELARRERKTAGEFVSELMREALHARATPSADGRSKRNLYGFEPIPAGGAVVTNELVDQLREELGI